MDTHEKNTFIATYEWAKQSVDLPWAHAEPLMFLAEICSRRKPGKALDIGCGAGTDSVFLATQGWDVTSLDFVPKALEFTEQRAKEAGVSVTPVEADITQWQPPAQFDLIVDHGLLHNMDPVRFPAYRECVLKALAPDGEFVLLHWHPRFENQPDGEMGPTRRDRDEIKAFFAPELQERWFAREELESQATRVGGGTTQAVYWFRRNQAHQQPLVLLEQIEATLQRHDVDYQALMEGELPGDVADDLMAVLLGPGRLGIHHVEPAPGEVAAVVGGFAAHAGKPVEYVEKLLRIFASVEAGSICGKDARCNVCEVAFCKRLRNR